MHTTFQIYLWTSTMNGKQVRAFKWKLKFCRNVVEMCGCSNILYRMRYLDLMQTNLVDIFWQPDACPCSCSPQPCFTAEWGIKWRLNIIKNTLWQSCRINTNAQGAGCKIECFYPLVIISTFCKNICTIAHHRPHCRGVQTKEMYLLHLYLWEARTLMVFLFFMLFSVSISDKITKDCNLIFVEDKRRAFMWIWTADCIIFSINGIFYYIQRISDTNTANVCCWIRI